MALEKVIFIAYANKAMAYSLQRIGKQAQQLGVFDEVILYTPDDLPEYIQNSPLMKYSYGGGYWAWKPCIIKEALRTHEEGTIVCYADAGCTLNSGIEWTLYKELMKEKDFLCFKYRDKMLEWEKFGSTCTKIKHWTKKESILFYDSWVNDKNWKESNKIWGGCIWVKGKENPIINAWLDIYLNHPNVIIDPTENDIQYPFFAQHKHDQSLLTAITYKFRDDCWILPELSETCGKDTAIVASRVRCTTRFDFWILKLKDLIRLILGKKLVALLKKCSR